MGWNAQFNRWDSQLKSVVLHEMGHAIQQQLFGLQNLNYTAGNATQAICKCDHVFDPLDRQHCIQSRERSGAAQLEGFGHFIAAIAQNNAAQNDASFPYYKELLWADGTVYPPPVGISAYNYGKWMESFCAGSNAGTEIDWMNFFYWVHRRTTSAYSLAQIRAVYRQACGGANCTSATDTTWSSLATAVNALHGPLSTKAVFWRNYGDTVGVDF